MHTCTHTYTVQMNLVAGSLVFYNLYNVMILKSGEASRQVFISGVGTIAAVAALAVTLWPQIIIFIICYKLPIAKASLILWEQPQAQAASPNILLDGWEGLNSYAFEKTFYFAL